jgi:hypothetical protein
MKDQIHNLFNYKACNLLNKVHDEILRDVHDGVPLDVDVYHHDTFYISTYHKVHMNVLDQLNNYVHHKRYILLHNDLHKVLDVDDVYHYDTFHISTYHKVHMNVLDQ